MADYTKLSNVEIRSLIRSYPIIEVKSITLLDGGYTNSSYLIQSEKENYVLTVCNDKNKDQIGLLINLLIQLERFNFPAPRIIKTNSGKKITFFQNKPVYLKTYIEGSVTNIFNISNLYELGVTIGKLHLIPSIDSLPTGHPYGLSHFESILKIASDHPYLSWLSEVKLYLELNMVFNLPRGLVHGDIFHDNIVQNSNSLSIIDFEESSYSQFLVDLGMAIIGVCSQNSEIDFNKVNSLIRGYETVRKLSNREKKYLRVFTIYAAVTTSFWRFRQYNLFYPNSKRKDKYELMVLLANNIRSLSNAEFISKIFST